MSLIGRVVLPLAVVAGLVAGCTTPRSAGTLPADASTTRPAGATSTPAAPSAWIGRWQGASDTTLDIRATPQNDVYALVFHQPGRVDVTHEARAAGGQLFYQAGQTQTALKPGTGAASAERDQRALTYCLVSLPGHTTYCRRRDTADALALAHGAFVAIRQECEQARAQDTVFFDGQSLRHVGQAQCHTRTIGQQGMVYSLQASCMGSASSGPGTANLVATTPDTQHLALTPRGQDTRLYRYCATGSLPPALQSEAKR